MNAATDVLRKVTSLLVRAYHPATPKPERDACRAKVSELKAKYGVRYADIPDTGLPELDAQLAKHRPQRTELDDLFGTNPFVRHYYEPSSATNARYDGFCRICNRSYSRGERIAKDRKTWGHVRCVVRRSA